MKRRKITKRQVQLLQDNTDLILLDFIYDRHMQAHSFVSYGVDESYTENIEKLKNTYGIRISQEQTQPDRWEYCIQPEHLEKAKKVLSSFWHEVWQ